MNFPPLIPILKRNIIKNGTVAALKFHILRPPQIPVWHRHGKIRDLYPFVNDFRIKQGLSTRVRATRVNAKQKRGADHIQLNKNEYIAIKDWNWSGLFSRFQCQTEYFWLSRHVVIWPTACDMTLSAGNLHPYVACWKGKPSSDRKKEFGTRVLNFFCWM